MRENRLVWVGRVERGNKNKILKKIRGIKEEDNRKSYGQKIKWIEIIWDNIRTCYVDNEIVY